MQTKLTFSKNVGFKKELNRKIEDYFEKQEISPRGNIEMYIKTAIIFTWLISSWIFITFIPVAGWLKLIASVSLGFAMSAVAFNVSHDANHSGYSLNKSVNSILGLTMDLMGVSSYFWRQDHNVQHHIYTNIVGHDTDIANNSLVRTASSQEYHSYHRFQHIYSWFLYSFMAFFWMFNDVRKMFVKPDLNTEIAPLPTGKELIIFWLGKLLWIGWQVVIPIALGNNPLIVLTGFVISNAILGFVLGIVFQLAHLVDVADYIVPESNLGVIEDDWAIHQLKTTVDFSPRNPLINWYVGGLNYQAIHHLFPKICHVHYPKIAEIFKEVCNEFGVEYKVQETFWGAINSHYRQLKALGTQNYSGAMN